jgi:hypothetical protein
MGVPLAVRDTPYTGSMVVSLQIPKLHNTNEKVKQT